MVDSLLITGVKAHKLHALHPDATETFAHAQQSFATLVALLEAGSATLPPASTIKDYSRTGEPGLLPSAHQT
jgi:hypothetical protein